jgi:hypothetical protein
MKSLSIATISLILLNALSIAPAQANPKLDTCNLQNSTYSAIGNPDWRIEVKPAQKRFAAVESATFLIKHKTRGEIGRYALGQSNGYGSFSLRDLSKKVDDPSPSLKPAFFDQHWRADRLLNSAPKYLFISGLGSADWYGNSPQSRETPVGELMWQLSSCSGTQSVS